jgi:tetratricopeptide (TPR) repeat protein
MRTREVAGDVQSAHSLLRGGGIDAMASAGLGHHEAALQKLETAMAIGRELGTTGTYLTNYQSAIYREVFDLDAARAATETALEASRALAFGMPRRFALSDLLFTALLAGDVGRAQADWPALWEDAADATGWTRWLIRGRLAVARAEIASIAEPPESAAEWAAKAVDVTVRTRRRKYEAQARSLLGCAFVTLGRRDEGLAELRRAVAFSDALVNPAGRWRSRAALSDGLLATGDDGAAQAARAEAREILIAFAETLAPERAATLRAAQPVREILGEG